MSRTEADLGGGKAEIPCRTTHHHCSVLISLRNTGFDRTRSPGFSFSGQPMPHKDCNQGVEINVFVTRCLNIQRTLKCLSSLKQLHLTHLQMQQDLCKMVQRALSSTCESREASREGKEDAVSGPSADQGLFLLNMHSCSLECISQLTPLPF